MVARENLRDLGVPGAKEDRRLDEDTQESRAHSFRNDEAATFAVFALGAEIAAFVYAFTREWSPVPVALGAFAADVAGRAVLSPGPLFPPKTWRLIPSLGRVLLAYGLAPIVFVGWFYKPAFVGDGMEWMWPFFHSVYAFAGASVLVADAVSRRPGRPPLP